MWSRWVLGDSFGTQSPLIGKEVVWWWGDFSVEPLSPPDDWSGTDQEISRASDEIVDGGAADSDSLVRATDKTKD